MSCSFRYSPLCQYRHPLTNTYSLRLQWLWLHKQTHTIREKEWAYIFRRYFYVSIDSVNRCRRERVRKSQSVCLYECVTVDIVEIECRILILLNEILCRTLGQSQSQPPATLSFLALSLSFCSPLLLFSFSFLPFVWLKRGKGAKTRNFTPPQFFKKRGVCERERRRMRIIQIWSVIAAKTWLLWPSSRSIALCCPSRSRSTKSPSCTLSPNPPK